MRFLAISGSLRALSHNGAALKAAEILAPPEVQIVPYTGLGDLPLYNYDLDTDTPPAPVLELRREVGRSNGLLIASPEYAHGIAGPMKNALDWLVGSAEFPDKPIGLINTSPRAIHAQAQIREVLKTMSALLVEEASFALPLLGTTFDGEAIAADKEMADEINSALKRFCDRVSAGENNREARPHIL